MHHLTDKLNEFLDDWSERQDDKYLSPKPLRARYSPEDQKCFIEFLAYDEKINIRINVNEADWKNVEDIDKALKAPLKIIQNCLFSSIATAFYKSKYNLIFEHDFAEPESRILRSNTQTCRFCNLDSTSVSFKLNAHAIPDSAGNKTLFSDYECDDCNKFFGTGMENDFGQFTNLARTLTGVQGKKGIPNYQTKEGQISIEKGIVNITPLTKKFFSTDKKKSTISGVRPSFVPMQVLKALHKMAFSIMPEELVLKYGFMREWLLSDSNSDPPDQIRYLVLEAFCPSSKFENGCCMLFQKKVENSDFPEVIFLLFFGLFGYQIVIDSSNFSSDSKFNFVPFSFAMAKAEIDEVTIFQRKFGSTTKVKEEFFEVDLFHTS